MLHLTHIETKIDGKSYHEDTAGKTDYSRRDWQFTDKKELEAYRKSLIAEMPPYITSAD